MTQKLFKDRLELAWILLDHTYQNVVDYKTYPDYDAKLFKQNHHMLFAARAIISDTNDGNFIKNDLLLAITNLYDLVFVIFAKRMLDLTTIILQQHNKPFHPSIYFQDIFEQVPWNVKRYDEMPACALKTTDAIRAFYQRLYSIASDMEIKNQMILVDEEQQLTSLDMLNAIIEQIVKDYPFVLEL